MSPQLKQRIIGGLILVAIAAFATPFLLHHSQPTAQNPTGDSTDATTTATTTAQNQPQVELQLPNSQAPNGQQSAAINTNSTTSTNATSEPQYSSMPTSPAPAATPKPNNQVVQMPAETTITNSSGSVSATPAATPSKQVTPDVESSQDKMLLNSESTPASPAPASTTVVATSAPKSSSEEPKATMTPDSSTVPKSEVVQPKEQPEPTLKSPPIIHHKANITTKSSKHVKGTYFLQVAAFANNARADRVVEQLSAKGIHAFLRTQPTNGVILTRIFIGPFSTVQIKKYKNILKREFGFKSVIKRNLP